MSLQNWLQIGHLNNHQATVAEVRSLLGVVDREFADAGVAGLSDDGRFTHAYDGGYFCANSPSMSVALSCKNGPQGIMLFGSTRWNSPLATRKSRL